LVQITSVRGMRSVQRSTRHSTASIRDGVQKIIIYAQAAELLDGARLENLYPIPSVTRITLYIFRAPYFNHMRSADAPPSFSSLPTFRPSRV